MSFQLERRNDVLHFWAKVDTFWERFCGKNLTFGLNRNNSKIPFICINTCFTLFVGSPQWDNGLSLLLWSLSQLFCFIALQVLCEYLSFQSQIIWIPLHIHSFVLSNKTHKLSYLKIEIFLKVSRNKEMHEKKVLLISSLMLSKKRQIW